jgi:multisubunit Na+/H+ antiporter MnhB subunit
MHALYLLCRPLLAESQFGFTAILAFALAVVLITFIFRDLERRRWHETARQAIEKGRPYPEVPGLQLEGRCTPDGRHRQRMGLVIGGLVNVGVGIGLYILLATIVGMQPMRFVSAIPFFIGIALLIGAFISGMTEPRPRDDGRGPDAA